MYWFPYWVTYWIVGSTLDDPSKHKVLLHQFYSLLFLNMLISYFIPSFNIIIVGSLVKLFYTMVVGIVD